MDDPVATLSGVGYMALSRPACRHISKAGFRTACHDVEDIMRMHSVRVCARVFLFVRLCPAVP